MRDRIPQVGRHRPSAIPRPPVVSRLLWFWVGTVLMSGVVVAVSTQLGLSLLWGFSASLLPSVCFAWYGFRQYGGAHRARAALHAVYRAEALKFLITAALFAAVFMQVGRINLPVFFLAFVCGQMASWLVTARALKERRR